MTKTHRAAIIKTGLRVETRTDGRILEARRYATGNRITNVYVWLTSSTKCDQITRDRDVQRVLKVDKWFHVKEVHGERKGTEGGGGEKERERERERERDWGRVRQRIQRSEFNANTPSWRKI